MLESPAEYRLKATVPQGRVNSWNFTHCWLSVRWIAKTDRSDIKNCKQQLVWKSRFQKTYLTAMLFLWSVIVSQSVRITMPWRTVIKIKGLRKITLEKDIPNVNNIKNVIFSKLSLYHCFDEILHPTTKFFGCIDNRNMPSLQNTWKSQLGKSNGRRSWHSLIFKADFTVLTCSWAKYLK